MRDKEQLFAELIRQSKNGIYRVCYSFVDQEADIKDLKQEIYIAIWSSMESFEEKSSWNTFIYRIALNTAMNFSAKLKGSRNAQDLEYNEADHPQYEYSESAKEKQIEKMRKCIRQLQKEDRSVISLVLENLSYKEIAGVLGISVNHVGVKIKRAKGRLLKKMEESHGEL